MTFRLPSRRGLGIATTMLAAAAGTVGAASNAAASPSAATSVSCIPYVAILPAFAQHRDMALGFPNAPLADRDSSGISFAESWRLIPHSGGTIKLVNRLVVDGVEAAASTNHGLPADALISTSRTQADRWVQETTVGLTKFRNASTGKYITYVPGNQTAPFRVRDNGAEGQYFKVKVLGC